MKSGLRILLLTILIGVLGVGCGDDTTKPSTPQAPNLPPSDSWNFDLSFFDQQAPPAPLTDRAREAEVLTSANWLNAALRVAFVKLVAVGALTPPYLAFGAAIHSSPVAEGDSTYLWTYSWTDSTNQSVQIHLRGHVRPDHVEWALRLTAPHANPPLDEFLWFTGESSLTAFTGYWIFNDNVEGQPVPSARIDWTYTAPRDRVLIFENIQEASADFGDSLTYQVDGAVGSLMFHDISEGLESDITWNVLTGTGSLQVPDYNNGERACWNEQRQDVECAVP